MSDLRHYTAEEVSELMGGNPTAKTLQEWARGKRIPHRKIGRFIRWTAEDIEELSESMRVTARPYIAQSSRSRAASRRRKTA